MTRSGKVFDLTATILTGTNPVFRRQQIKLAEALDTSRLYLLNVGNPGALELLPFVRVTAGSTGQDACYFYNRVQEPKSACLLSLPCRPGTRAS